MIDHAKRQLLNNKEAAARLRMSESWLNKDRVGAALIPYLKIGTRVLYDAADLDNFLASARRRNTAQSTTQHAA